MNGLSKFYSSESGLAILTIKGVFKLYCTYDYSNSKELLVEKDIYKSNNLAQQSQ